MLSCIYQSNGLSFQGHDRHEQRIEVFPETISAETTPSTEISLQDQRNSMRKTRLQLLGMISEKFLSWVFNDMMPEEISHRARRSTDEGNEQNKAVVHSLFLFLTIFTCLDETDPSSRFLEVAATAYGAIVNKNECRKRIVCSVSP